MIFFRITGQGIFLKITIIIISGPPTSILKRKKEKPFYEEAQYLLQSSTLSCRWDYQSPEEIVAFRAFVCEILNYSVLKWHSWDPKLFPRSISQCATDCFKKESDHNRNKTNNNNISGTFNKSRLTNSELCGQQQWHLYE